VDGDPGSKVAVEAALARAEAGNYLSERFMETSASSPTQTPRVTLIEDESVFRQLLKRSLQKRKGWEAVDDFSDGDAGLAHCLAYPPDLLLVDLNLPGKSGLEIISEVRQRSPSTRILVLTAHADTKLPTQLIGLGVAGYVDKTSPLAYVLQAIDTVLTGGMFFASHVAAEPPPAAPEPPAPPGPPPSVLSAREIEVAKLVSSGLSSKEVAAKLNLSTRTVEKHRANIMMKLRVREVASLVRWCMQHGLV
jgi:DNA-binding NarL/FixJ family response regulator